jgi:hypothetical protein
MIAVDISVFMVIRESSLSGTHGYQALMAIGLPSLSFAAKRRARRGKIDRCAWLRRYCRNGGVSGARGGRLCPPAQLARAEFRDTVSPPKSLKAPAPCYRGRMCKALELPAFSSLAGQRIAMLSGTPAAPE